MDDIFIVKGMRSSRVVILLTMPMLQQSWVQTRHSPTQWNLRGGRCSTDEYGDKKIKTIPLIIKVLERTGGNKYASLTGNREKGNSSSSE